MHVHNKNLLIILLQAEINSGDVSKSIQCYMKEQNVTEQVARDHIRCLIRNYWTKLNQELNTFSNFTEPFKHTLLGLPRAAQCFYQYREGFTEPDNETRDHINSVIIEPIPL